MRISDWSSDVCSSDLAMYGSRSITTPTDPLTLGSDVTFAILDADGNSVTGPMTLAAGATTPDAILTAINGYLTTAPGYGPAAWNHDRMEIKLEGGYRLAILDNGPARSEEHTSELPSLMRITYAVF